MWGRHAPGRRAPEFGAVLNHSRLRADRIAHERLGEVGFKVSRRARLFLIGDVAHGKVVRRRAVDREVAFIPTL